MSLCFYRSDWILNHEFDCVKFSSSPFVHRNCPLACAAMLQLSREVSLRNLNTGLKQILS